MDYLVPPTICPEDLVSSALDVKTWAGRVRAFHGEPVSFLAWNLPEGTYAQVGFTKGTVSGARPKGLKLRLSGKLVNGIVEGFVTEDNKFIAARILREDGVPAYDSLLENFDQLCSRGFHAVRFLQSQSKGPEELIRYCLSISNEKATYPLLGVLCTVSDPHLAAALRKATNQPAPLVGLVFKDAGVLKKDKYVFDFVGKFPEKQDTYRNKVVAAGHKCGTFGEELVDYVVAANINSSHRVVLDAKKVLTTKVITLDEFFAWLEQNAKSTASNTTPATAESADPKNGGSTADTGSAA
jgi:hypothetical protein